MASGVLSQRHPPLRFQHHPLQLLLSTWAVLSCRHCTLVKSFSPPEAAALTPSPSSIPFVAARQQCRNVDAFFSPLHPFHHRLRPVLRSLIDDGETTKATSYNTDPSSSGTSSFFRKLVQRFQGDFDNYNQVQLDRAANKQPREGGGHEHIHCTIVPISVGGVLSALNGPATETKDTAVGDKDVDENGRHCAAVLSAFYFDGTPSRIFRFRLYVLRDEGDDEGGDGSVSMQLYSLGPNVEGALRRQSDEPTRWGATLEGILSERKDGTESISEEEEEPFQELERCDVLWTPTADPVRHSYAHDDEYMNSSDGSHRLLSPSKAYHAVMVNAEGTIVDSTMTPGTKILVKDELSLWEDNFWINDRGYDPDTGEFVYGNWDCVPYKMERVTRFTRQEAEEDDKKIKMGRHSMVPPEAKRVVTNKDLVWTLGERHRVDEDVYRKKMEGIGGVSTRFNRGEVTSTSSAPPPAAAGSNEGTR